MGKYAAPEEVQALLASEIPSQWYAGPVDGQIVEDRWGTHPEYRVSFQLGIETVGAKHWAKTDVHAIGRSADDLIEVAHALRLIAGIEIVSPTVRIRIEREVQP